MTAWGCKKCEGLGYRVVSQLVQRRPQWIVELCSCVQDLCLRCPGDKTPPYVFLDEENNSIKACPCKTPRETLSTVKSLFVKSTIPPKFKYRRLDDFQIQEKSEVGIMSLSKALDLSHHFIQMHAGQEDFDGKGLFFFGEPGTGKSFLSSLILNEIILRTQKSCRYVKITRDFFNQLRSTYSVDSNNYGRTESLFSEIAQVEVLVIDDFGIQADSDWEQRMIYDLIDQRYENELTTIITTNLRMEDIIKLFKGRIYSRLREMVHFQEFIAEDYRGILSEV